MQLDPQVESIIDIDDYQILIKMTSDPLVKSLISDAVNQHKITKAYGGEFWYNTTRFPSLEEARGARRRYIIRALGLEDQAIRKENQGIATQMGKAKRAIQVKGGKVIRHEAGKPDEVLSDNPVELDELRRQEAVRLWKTKEAK